MYISHLDPPANGQAVIFLAGLLEVFHSELSNLATVSDKSVRYQAITVVLWSNIEMKALAGSSPEETSCLTDVMWSIGAFVNNWS